MPVETWLIFTLGFMIFGSIVALELKDILSSIIAIGVVGLGVSISFLFLQAPDLAIVQFLFEIFALIILVRAFIRKENHQLEASPTNTILTVIGILAVLVLFVVSIPVFKLLPPFGEPLMTVSQHYLDAGARETGAANLVASVILDYRAYDTLGEVTVLFTAILGVFAILRSTAKHKTAGGSHE
jgi:multicomponent Na+:H+ antiporter subunit B